MKNKLKDERLKLSLTQAELAAQAGVSRQTIISIESGRYLPSIVLAMKLAKLLKTQVEELFILEKGD